MNYKIQFGALENLIQRHQINRQVSNCSDFPGNIVAWLTGCLLIRLYKVSAKTIPSCHCHINLPSDTWLGTLLGETSPSECFQRHFPKWLNYLIFKKSKYFECLQITLHLILICSNALCPLVKHSWQLDRHKLLVYFRELKTSQKTGYLLISYSKLLIIHTYVWVFTRTNYGRTLLQLKQYIK